MQIIFNVHHVLTDHDPVFQSEPAHVVGERRKTSAGKNKQFETAARLDASRCFEEQINPFHRPQIGDNPHALRETSVRRRLGNRRGKAGEIAAVGNDSARFGRHAPLVDDRLAATITVAEGEKADSGTDKAEEAEKKEGGEKAEAAEKPMQAVAPEKVMMGAFLDASNIAVGPEKEVKAVIDVLKKKGENVTSNTELMAQIKGVNKNAMAWGVFAFKAEDVKKMVEATPMLSSLASLKAIILAFDYSNKVLDMEIKAVTSDAGKNKDIADMLNGFKAMGSMAVGGKPEIGELLGKIEITSASDNVRIHAALPEELLNKLGKMAQTELMNKMGGIKTAEPAKGEEKKAEEIKK